MLQNCLIFMLIYSLALGKVFYIDDGEATTIPVDLNTERINRLQAQILSLLGLRRPADSELPDEVASRYMSSLYKSIENRESVNFSPSFKYLEDDPKNLPFDFERISDWHTADTIISFVPKKIRILESGVDTNINELEFDLSGDDVSVDSARLLNAELYFIAEDANGRNYTLPKNSIQLFTKGREAELVPASYDRVNTAHEALVALNITSIIDEWMRQPSETKNLFARIKDVNGENLVNIEDAKLHVFGVGFFTEDKSNHFRRRKRSADVNVDQDWAYSPNSVSNRVNLFDAPRPSVDNGRRKCKRRALYVDFKDLGWHSWVIAPNGYQADYCDGYCEFALDSSMNPTNHAIVQTLVHLIDNKRAAEAKCAPTAMNRSPLRILFYNNKKVIIKGYHEMQVRECGCQ